jgi:glycosyltransferase involved in cell wall biosynthesis
MKKNPKIIGIIMTYNCADMLKDTYSRLPKKIFGQIIVVDDGSEDATVDVAKRLGIKTFTHAHGGYGVNLRYGLKKAIRMKADYMMEIHGDGQYDHRTIPKAVEKIKKENIDLLLGTRFSQPRQALIDGMSFPRFVSNIIFSFIDRHLFQIPLTEFYNGFRIYSKKLVDSVNFKNTSNNYFYSFQVIIQAKFHNLKIGEIPIRCDYHKRHTSENFWAAAVHAFETFYVFWEYKKAKTGIKTNLFS